MRVLMYFLFVLVVVIPLLTLWVLSFDVFGDLPSGDRLNKIQKLPNYRNGSLQNLSPTPMKPDNVSYWDMIAGMLKGNPNGVPLKPLPHVKPDFSNTESVKIIWFGHSSYYLQIDGIKILVDPVFSPRPSPFSFLGTKQFRGTDFIKAEDVPDLDIVLITHDHYDHLDYPTILKLKEKTGKFVTSVGVGSHLSKWGVPDSQVTELAWNDTFDLFGLKFRALPARHFTGRTFKRNQTLWSAFVLEGSTKKIYLGGDSGYDTHFKNAGDQYGPFDLAILECGQYNTYWPWIHMFPEQTVKAAQDLKAKVLFPVHWGKFKLAMHDWNEPIIRATKQAKLDEVAVTTPVMGESIIVDQTYPSRSWWLD